MLWWILIIVVALVVVGWVVRRAGRGSASHADASEVNQTRGKDQGRGYGPTSV